MWELLLVILVIWAILIFFYKQAVYDFTINQVEWIQRADLLGLMKERVPLVIRGLPAAAFWTTDDIQARANWYADVPVFDGVEVGEWIKGLEGEGAAGVICPWKDSQADALGDAAGIRVWENKWIRPHVVGPIASIWTRATYQCWAGRMGLRKLYAVWTLILPVEGAITVSILPQTVEGALPPIWRGGFPTEWTARDTPFLSDVKFVDVVVRPGTGLMVPAHWFVTWRGLEGGLPMVCTVSYHTPISRMAAGTERT